LKRFITFVSLAGSLLLSPLAANAGVITLYDIDFSAPTHRAGVSPSYGSAIDQVSYFSFSRPTVENTFGGVANQSLHFDAATNTSEGIRLNMGQSYSNYQISFDVYSEYLARTPSYAFRMIADTSSGVRSLDFHRVGRVARIANRVPGERILDGGFFADGTSYNVMLDYDMVLSQVSLWLDGGFVGTQAINTNTGDDINRFRFALTPALSGVTSNPLVKVNLDNIKVTTQTVDAPEPSALLILSLGLIGLVSARTFTGHGNTIS
jgi:hypothetical protein